MKKISWIRRIFMSWRKLEDYFNVSRTGVEINEYKIKYEEQSKYIEENKKNIEELVKELREKITEKENQLTTLKDELSRFKNNLEVNKNIIKEKDDNLQQQKIKIERLESDLKSAKEQTDIWLKQLSNRLEPLDKINRTFFDKSGNKGKGELGEHQLERILEKAGVENEFWVKNLLVGKNNVEFAIVAPEGKYIPVDSKVLESSLDEEGKIVIDEAYARKVKEEAKKVAKYLGKSNTTDYGILVLQNDSIQIELFENFPEVYKQIVDDYKIYVMSPSSFIQYSWSIVNILEIYKKVQNDEKIYDEIISTLDTVTKFGNNLFKVHKTFNIAMKQYGTLQKKQVKLQKKLVKNGKIKELPLLENNEPNEVPISDSE